MNFKMTYIIDPNIETNIKINKQKIKLKYEIGFHHAFVQYTRL